MRAAHVYWLRKHFIGIHEADEKRVVANHDGPLSGLLESEPRDPTGYEEPVMLPDWVLFVPRDEFQQLITGLPEFKDLPMFWAGWEERNRPTELVVQCIESEDIMAIDTQGYEYARYKSAVKWV